MGIPEHTAPVSTVRSPRVIGMAGGGFTMWNIKASLARAGIDPEKFDVHAHIDRKISHRENLRNIESMTGAGRTARHISRHLEEDRVRRGGKAKTYRETFAQTGTSNLEMDRARGALPPGKRGHGKGAYYEYRRNRSDRPGSRV